MEPFNIENDSIPIQSKLKVQTASDQRQTLQRNFQGQNERVGKQSQAPQDQIRGSFGSNYPVQIFSSRKWFSSYGSRLFHFTSSCRKLRSRNGWYKPGLGAGVLWAGKIVFPDIKGVTLDLAGLGSISVRAEGCYWEFYVYLSMVLVCR